MAAATPKRKDPARRAPSQTRNGVNLINRDPTRHYVLVNTADKETLAQYQDDGYVEERQSEGGVKFGLGRTSKNGEAMMYRGHVLMSISLDEKAAVDAEGKEWADVVENKIVDRNAVQADLMRGISPRYMQAYSEIGSLQREVG